MLFRSIGVGAATAVVLSLAGAKTPVVIGSAAALGVAGGWVTRSSHVLSIIKRSLVDFPEPLY